MTSNANNVPVKYKLIFKHVPVPVEPNKDYSLLQLFVEEPWEKEEVKKLHDWLISKNIDVNRKDWHLSLESKVNNSNTVPNNILYVDEAYKSEVASKLKNILPFLVSCNDDINYTTDNGETILHVYLANDESCYKYLRNSRKSKVFEIVKTLLQRGASVNAVDKSGKTPLHVAIENRKFEVTALMMDFFSNVDACDDQGNTVLHTAVNRSLGNDGLQVKECTNIVQILLSKGADPNRKNNKGMTSVQLAANKYNVDMLKIFKENNGDLSDENLLLLVYRDNWYAYDELMIEKTLEFLVDQGFDVNVQDKNGYSPLHYAATWDRAAEKLIKLGADVNCQTKEGHQTPLHFAAIDAKSKRIELFLSANRAVGALLRAGAYWDAVDDVGHTPFHHVLESGNSENATCFLRFGADINDPIASSLIMGGEKNLRKVVFSHAVKLKAVGLPVAKVYEPHLDLTLELRSECKDCTEEVKKLKSYTISTGVSIYHFLHMTPRRQLSYVERLPRDLESKFPIYANFIVTARNDVVRRNELIEPAKWAWYQINKSNLPDICVERIFYFLNNWSLKTLIDVAETNCDDTSNLISKSNACKIRKIILCKGLFFEFHNITERR